MKVGKNAGNLNKIKSDPEAALLAAAAEKPKVKTETGKVVFSKFDFVAEEAAPEDASGGKKKNLDPKAALGMSSILENYFNIIKYLSCVHFLSLLLSFTLFPALLFPLSHSFILYLSFVPSVNT